MQTAENVVRMAGWLDKCVDGTPDVGNLESIEPEVNQPPKSWKAAVQAKKQEMIDAKAKHMPTYLATNLSIHNTQPNMVDVDKSFLNHIFHASSIQGQKIIDDTVSKFLLNTEQERAFRIIANYATLRPSEKL